MSELCLKSSPRPLAARRDGVHLQPAGRQLPERRHPSPADHARARVARAGARSARAETLTTRSRDDLQTARADDLAQATAPERAEIESRRCDRDRRARTLQPHRPPLPLPEVQRGDQGAPEHPGRELPAARRQVRQLQGAESPSRYPIVELATALLSAAVAWRFGWHWQTLAALVFTWALVALTVIDLDHHDPARRHHAAAALARPAVESRLASRACAPPAPVDPALARSSAPPPATCCSGSSTGPSSC